MSRLAALRDPISDTADSPAAAGGVREPHVPAAPGSRSKVGDALVAPPLSALRHVAVLEKAPIP